MNKLNRTTWGIVLLAVVILFLLIGGGMMSGSMMNGGMMGHGPVGGPIPTLLTLGVGILIGWLIFGQKR